MPWGETPAGGPPPRRMTNRRLGPHQRRRARAHPQQDRRPHGGQPRQVLAARRDLDNGKPIRETTGADMPLAVDHFRYFAGCVRAQEGSLSEIDENTVAYHFHEPLGVVGQIIPWNFPLLMAAWKLAPALAAGNCVVIKPAEQTPLDPGVAELIGTSCRPACSTSSTASASRRQAAGLQPAHRQDRLHRRDDDRPADHAVRLGEPHPGDAGARRQVAQHLLRRRDGEDDDFLDKALEGLRDVRASTRARSAPARRRALVQESIYDRFMERPGARRRDQAGQSARPRDHDRRAGLERAAREDPVLHRHRQAGRREGADRRRARNICRATSRAATTSSRPCSRATTRCASSRRRSSARWSR
jgi:aldehyde dehydrogenase